MRLAKMSNRFSGDSGKRRLPACSSRQLAAKLFSLVLISLALSFPAAGFAAQTDDTEYEAVAEEYIKTYLAAHPLEGTALGLHEYDGKISDYSRLALDAELSRLRRFDDRLAKFDPKNLSPRQSIDLRILQAAVKRDIFEMQDMSVFERNPMLYARAGDVNVYIKRNFAPLEDRVRSLIAIESQIPNILIAARTNLDEKLPGPFVELAIQIARGSADFLKKDLVAAVSGLKDEQLRVAFQTANRKAATALTDYAAWLEREKLPKATLDFALGEEKFRRFLVETELVDLPPGKILEIGMAQLKAEQEAFSDYTSDVVSIHEVYPGHYVQFLHLNASPATKVEKIFGSYAFIEGWAHYCEKMMIDEGFGSPASSPPSEDDVKSAAKYRMAQTDEALLRLCRLCVSLKVHTQNMSIDDATKFFHDNCYYEQKPARQEAMRATFDPGYLNYTLGKLQILKLRDDYKSQQGADFSLQKFHNELLSHGMPPIRLLREIMLKDQSKWDQVL